MPKLKTQKNWIKKKNDRSKKYFTKTPEKEIHRDSHIEKINVGAGISRDLIIEPSVDNNINVYPLYESDNEEINTGAGTSRDLIIEPSLDNNIDHDPLYESDTESSDEQLSDTNFSDVFSIQNWKISKKTGDRMIKTAEKTQKMSEKNHYKKKAVSFNRVSNQLQNSDFRPVSVPGYKEESD